MCATRMVTRSEAMANSASVQSQRGNYTWACCWGFRFSWVTLLDEIGQCWRKRLFGAYTTQCLCSLVYVREIVKHKMDQNNPILGLTKCLRARIAATHVACDAGGVRLGRGWLWGKQNDNDGRSNEET